MSSYATTRNKGKEITKPITPPFESESKEDSDPEQAKRDKQMQKNLAIIAKYLKNIYKPTNNNLKTSSNTRNKNVDTTTRTGNDINTRQFVNKRTVIEYGQFAKECRKPKRDKDYAYHKEKMMLCKQEEKVDSNTTPDSSDMCNNEFEDDKNANDCKNECIMLSNLIENLKLDTDENKKIQKLLKKANTTLTRELNESKSALKESNDILDRCQSALHKKDTKLEKYKVYKNC
ncbi:hypothetical protein Tco_1139450 [Tanacetum coccineum]